MDYYGLGICQLVITSLAAGVCFAELAPEWRGVLADIFEDWDLFWEKEKPLLPNILLATVTAPVVMAMIFFRFCIAAFMLTLFVFMPVYITAEKEIVHLAEMYSTLNVSSLFSVFLAVPFVFGLLGRIVFKRANVTAKLTDEIIFALQVLTLIVTPLAFVFITGPLLSRIELEWYLPLMIIMSSLFSFAWTAICAWFFVVLKGEAKKRREALIRKDFDSGRKLEFLTIKEALIIENGWRLEHFEVLDAPYFVDTQGSEAKLTLHPKSRKDLGRPETKVRAIFRKGRHIVLCSNPLWGTKASALKGQLSQDWDTVLEIYESPGKRKKNTEYAPRIIFGGGGASLRFLSFPQHFLLARNRINGNGWLKTLLGW